jgi:hypothetical protein
MQLADELGCDFSDGAVIDHMRLPPVELWDSDEKLRGFLGIHETLVNLGLNDKVIELERAIKCCRSAAKGSIRGALLERSVMRLAQRHGCQVRRNVRLPEVAKESIDCVITLPDGREMYVMCQIDLWNGGQQTNRADKYLNRAHASLVSVVYNPYQAPKATRNNKKSQELHGWITQAHEQRKLMWLADLDDYLKEQHASKP